MVNFSAYVSTISKYIKPFSVEKIIFDVEK